MIDAEDREFRRVCDALREKLNRDVKALARRVPEDGSSPGVNYRRDRARDCLHVAERHISNLLSQLDHAAELIAAAEARP